VHPDGIGVFLASKFLYGKNGFTKRITGSDFYIELIKGSLKNNWSFFFFGDTDETLSKISKTNPDLFVKGFCNGFNFNNDKLIKDINTAKPDILIVGLGSPKQEDWIVTNRDNVNAKVIVAVGDGIKVFAGTKKRGTKLVRILGLEWFVRLINEPKRLWKRYLIGIPLFIFRILYYKFRLIK
jgi:N-acetylglucosaminyldiphosphoundecaprenol N-acetyl-beta-D-mannosaminyltransferase